ncbi:terminase, partial [Lactobacillus sp. XV13L]|nr:terminase [Lactobacillus sp. XV13L]
MKYKDIAEKYNVSLNTVKSWKSRYKWQRAPNQKGVHTKVKKGAHKTKSYAAIEELNNSELNEKQKAFVLEYLRLLNATQAYINVYGVGYNTAKTAGPRMLENVGVQKEIKRIRSARLHELAIEPLDLIADLAKEAKSDIGDYIGFKSWEEVLCGEDG